MNQPIQVSAAKQRGWTSNPTVLDTLFSFTKGDKRLWNAGKQWICADLTGNGSSLAVNYRNHRHYKTLTEALTTEG